MNRYLGGLLLGTMTKVLYRSTQLSPWPGRIAARGGTGSRVCPIHAKAEVTPLTQVTRPGYRLFKTLDKFQGALL